MSRENAARLIEFWKSEESFDVHQKGSATSLPHNPAGVIDLIRYKRRADEIQANSVQSCESVQSCNSVQSCESVQSCNSVQSCESVQTCNTVQSCDTIFTDCP